MYIKSIELVNFRNYEKLKLEFHEKVNIFTGDNAQGKTNLLEGVYVSSFGRSFRFGRDSEMIMFNTESCRVSVEARRGDEEIKVEIAIRENEKGIKLNGAGIKRTSELLENIMIVVFSPEDLKIVKEDPEKRRRFIDRELSQIRPAYYSDLSSYKRALAQRNALLKEKNTGIENFEVWDRELSGYGSKLIFKRKEFIEKISEISGETHKNITNGKETLKVTYKPSVYEGDDTEKAFLGRLRDTLKRDIYKGNTETGPHRDDIEISVNGSDVRKYGSQGQQRTAALSLKLSELELIKRETGEEAVLLLDDVLSELDGERQNFLINSLKDVQIFITSANIDGELKNKLPEGYMFKIKNGRAERDPIW